MKRTQIQFPDPLYDRIKEVAEMNDWALAEVVRRATELYVERFPCRADRGVPWEFPILNVGGDFLIDPAISSPEADAVELRNQ